MSNYKDLDKQRETQRKYREKNRDKINAYQRENYGAAYMRKWRAERPGQRERDRATRKKYYYENLEQEREKARIAMLANYRSQSGTLSEKRQRWADFVATKECEHCGLDDSECLDFHHTNPSEKTVCVWKSQMIVLKPGMSGNWISCRVSAAAVTASTDRMAMGEHANFIVENIILLLVGWS